LGIGLTFLFIELRIIRALRTAKLDCDQDENEGQTTFSAAAVLHGSAVQSSEKNVVCR
jgi:hypothetical protein